MPDDKFFIVFLAFFGLISITVFGGILFAIIKGLIQWNRNNSSPLLTMPATVVTKREHVSGGSGDSSSSTSYHVTFEVRGGERLEFRVRGREYGMLVEHDKGQLTYQGTRYKGFTRTPQDR